MNSKQSKGQIVFISKHANAASTRYRISQYLPLLEALGWQTSYCPANQGIAGKISMLRQARRADVVILQRKLLDAFTFRLLRAVSKKLVYDFDDAIFLNSNGKVSKKRQQAFERITANCELSIAGNEYLNSQSLAKQRMVVPTTVVMADYPTLNAVEQSYQLKAKNSELTLVWIGSSSTRKYLEQQRDLFDALGKSFGQIQLKVIADFDIEFKYLKTVCIPWSKATEQQQLLTTDIGIAPMTDDPWTQGKCALKVIQYMACGLPVISSKVGANAQVIVDGFESEQGTGFLAQSTACWLQAINTLSSETKRREMGARGRIRVQEYYSAEHAVTLLDKAFSSLSSVTD